MSNPSKRLEGVRTEVQVHWTEERARRVERSFLRRRRRQAISRSVAGVAVMLGILLAARELFHPPEPPTETLQSIARTAEDTSHRQPAEHDSSTALRLRDGSTVRLLDAASRISELLPSAAQSEARVLSVEVQRGGARFQVVRDPTRLFRVHAGRVIAEVLGTEFTVELRGDQSHVAVERGRVRVLWPGGRSELGAGESGTFPPEPPPDPVQIAGPQAPPETLPTTPPTTAASAAVPAIKLPKINPSDVAPAAKSEVASDGPDWMALAQEGHFDRSFALIMERGLGPVHGPAELLLAADVARLSRHPTAAIPLLRRVLREYPRDPRAPLAAFTLGRASLDELGQPREAAEAFRTVQDLEPEGPLASDALAREVEAWSRAGEQARAHERALHYLRRHPDGDRQRAVRRYGGID